MSKTVQNETKSEFKHTRCLLITHSDTLIQSEKREVNVDMYSKVRENSNAGNKHTLASPLIETFKYIGKDNPY